MLRSPYISLELQRSPQIQCRSEGVAIGERNKELNDKGVYGRSKNGKGVFGRAKTAREVIELLK